MQLIRSLIFIFVMYLWMLILGLVGAPFAYYSREWACWFLQMYCRQNLWLLEKICGLKAEYRGELPTGNVIIAAKHQSMMDIIMITAVCDQPSFVMKKQLRWAPILGFYAMRVGSAPVNRGAKKEAVAQMMKGREDKHIKQLTIYPQGTRVAPGDKLPYKFGTAILYERSDHPCIPAATNVGLFWGKHSLIRKKGTAVLEFLPAIQPGMEKDVFMVRIEQIIEDNSNRLMAEAGFDAS